MGGSARWARVGRNSTALARLRLGKRRPRLRLGLGQPRLRLGACSSVSERQTAAMRASAAAAGRINQAGRVRPRQHGWLACGSCCRVCVFTPPLVPVLLTSCPRLRPPATALYSCHSHKFSRPVFDAPNCAELCPMCPMVPNIGQLCPNVPNCAQIMIVPKYAQICPNVPKCAQICPNMPKCAQIFSATIRQCCPIFGTIRQNSAQLGTIGQHWVTFGIILSTRPCLRLWLQLCHEGCWGSSVDSS